MLNLFSLDNGQPFNAIPFNDVPFEKYLPLIKEAIEKSRADIEKIKTQKEAPTFANTIEAMEFSGIELERLSSVFFNLFNACSNEVFDKESDVVSTLLAQFSNDIQLDEQLFDRIKKVYDQKDQENLNTEQLSLLEKYYQDFVRNGALLDTEKKQKLRDLDGQMAQLGPRYSQNLLNATNAFLLEVTNQEDLKGLPQNAIESAKELAEKKEKPDSWLFSLQAPSFIPFMTYCPNRELRKELWMAYNQRAFKGHNSNIELCEKIAKLRAERAKLLGFQTHADFILSRRMAKSTKTVYSFLEDLKAPSYEAARLEVEELKAFKKDLSGEEDFQPWDFAFYSEKLKEKLYDYSEEDLRPYFKLENVVQGVFNHAHKLFNLSFKEHPMIQKYHDDVKVYEVSDGKEFIGLLYFDLFPRENKRGGAWMTSYLEQGADESGTYRPHISIVCNFTKPTKDTPSLLTFSEVETLFHEFGHALHGLLSKCHYTSIAGTNVLWDFVELPSQIMENWCTEKETLDSFAKHYKTGELLPDELFNKLKNSKNFLAGYASLRQVSFCYVDLAWHDTSATDVPSTLEVEEKVLAPISVLPRIPDTNFSVGFAHIFAGGYSAGYYSYKWAEVLDADAFEFFKEKGIYNPEVAAKFKDNILSRGGTEEPDVLYRNFRGRDPDPKALLRRSGLLQ